MLNQDRGFRNGRLGCASGQAWSHIPDRHSVGGASLSQAKDADAGEEIEGTLARQFGQEVGKKRRVRTATLHGRCWLDAGERRERDELDEDLSRLNRSPCVLGKAHVQRFTVASGSWLVAGRYPGP